MSGAPALQPDHPLCENTHNKNTARSSHPVPCPRLQLEDEKGDRSAYAKSTIVPAGAPRELGQLRDADGKEGF